MWSAHYGGQLRRSTSTSGATGWTRASSPASRTACATPRRTTSQARGRKLAYWDSVRPLFERYDLLLTPTISVAAFQVGRLNPEGWPQHAWDWFPWASFSYPFNFTGQPAATVPAGFTPAGLPVGLQIVGRRFADLTVLQASAAFETARPWHGLPAERPEAVRLADRGSAQQASRDLAAGLAQEAPVGLGVRLGGDAQHRVLRVGGDRRPWLAHELSRVSPRGDRADAVAHDLAAA